MLPRWNIASDFSNIRQLYFRPQINFRNLFPFILFVVIVLSLYILANIFQPYDHNLDTVSTIKSEPILEKDLSILTNTNTTIPRIIHGREHSRVSLVYFVSSFLFFITAVQCCRLIRRLNSGDLRNSRSIHISRRDGITMLALSRLFNIATDQLTARDAALLRIAFTQRDFNDTDYEMLQQLDESTSGNSDYEGCSESEISRLPMHSNEDYSDNKKCSVCLAILDQGDVMRTLPCLHQFHKECIDTWLRKKASCPICKFSVL